MSPSDAAVALRSLPRRFRAVLVRGDDEDTDRPDHLVQRPGADGLSAIDHARAAVRIVSERSPDVGPGATAGRTVSEVLADLEAATAAHATDVEHVPPGEWTRPAVDALSRVVTAAVDRVRAAERAVDEARRTA
jgi:hypothetical protein